MAPGGFATLTIPPAASRVAPAANIEAVPRPRESSRVLLGVASVPSPADAMLQPLAVAAERDLSDDAAEKLRRIMAPPGAGSTFSALAGWADTVKRRQPRPTVAAGQIVLSEMGKTS